MIFPLSFERTPDADAILTQITTRITPGQWIGAALAALMGLVAVLLSPRIGSIELMFVIGASFGYTSGAILGRLWTALVGLIFGLLSPIVVFALVIFVDIVIFDNG